MTTHPYADPAKVATALSVIGSGAVFSGDLILKQILVAIGDGGSPPISGTFYRRPDGISRYHRPDGTSFYLRP